MRCNRHLSLRSVLVATAVAFAAFAASAQAQTYDLRVVHNFAGSPDDGMYPHNGVQFDSAGNLYGTTLCGGAFDGGIIYKIAKDGTESILHSFEPVDDQGNVVDPNSFVIDSSTGDIYGSTGAGGKIGDNPGACDSGILGDGQIYKLAADGTFTILYAFDSDRTGAFPHGLIRDPQGNLYGFLGCSAKHGLRSILFKYGVNGTYTVLHIFDNSSFPVGSVIRDEAGNLYGATYTFPDFGGTIYRVAPDGSFTTLHLFANDVDGYPSSGLAGDRAGNLYGATAQQAPNGQYYSSTVFKLAPGGTFTTIYASGPFPPYTIPYVYAVLPVDGTIYGLSFDYSDVRPNRQGRTLFTIAPDGTYTKLHDFFETFSYTNSGDSGSLVLEHGRVYGTAESTGISPDGTIFSLGAAPQ